MLVRNSLAHMTARVTSLLAGLVSIPLVTITLGTEALGLVGAYAALQAMLGLFDLGLPIAVNRELSVLIGRKGSDADQARLIRSLEVVFWIMAALFALIGYLIKEPLAYSWLDVRELPRETVDAAIALIVAGLAVRFPVVYYSNVLFALSRHVYPNFVLSVAAVLRTAVAIVALTEYGVGIVGFFVIQLVANCAEVFLLIAGVWWRSGHRLIAPRYEPLRQVAGTAGILTAISLTAVALSQVDKIVLSNLLTLGDFGVYSAAYALASGLLALSYPVGNAVFPQLSRTLARDEFNTAANLVRLASELVVLAVVPLGAVVAMQASSALDILFLLRDVPPQLSTVLPLMMIGGMAQGFVTLPHLYQVAAGRAAAVLYVNLAYLVPYTVVVYVAATQWGLWGGALAFAAFNVARLLTHWIALSAGGRVAASWRSIALQAVAAGIAAILLARWAAIRPAGDLAGMVICVTSVAALSLIFLVALPGLRAGSWTTLRRMFASGD